MKLSEAATNADRVEVRWGIKAYEIVEVSILSHNDYHGTPGDDVYVRLTDADTADYIFVDGEIELDENGEVELTEYSEFGEGSVYTLAFYRLVPFTSLA